MQGSIGCNELNELGSEVRMNSVDFWSDVKLWSFLAENDINMNFRSEQRISATFISPKLKRAEIL